MTTPCDRKPTAIGAVPQSQLADRARARSSAPPKLALLLAVPDAERAAAALIVDAIATEIVPPGDLWAALRPVLAWLAREAADREADTIMDYADALHDAARELERADARRSWARWRAFRRAHPQHLHRTVLLGMRDAVRLFRGTT